MINPYFWMNPITILPINKETIIKTEIKLIRTHFMQSLLSFHTYELV